MVKVTVDVTGLYFRKEVSVDANSSVRDVMDAVQSDLTFPQLKYKTGIGNLFCSRIEIRHKDAPKPRQEGLDGSSTPFPALPVGVYFFDDSANGGTNPQLTWQYYVEDKDGKLKTGDDGNGKRTVIAFTKSNTGANPLRFEEGDVIRWRLVAIFTGPNGGPVPADSFAPAPLVENSIKMLGRSLKE